MTFYENPYSLNVYKFDIDKEEDLAQIESIKSNSMLSIRCLSTLQDKLFAKLDECANRILVRRVTCYRPASADGSESEPELVRSDHLEQFKAYILEQLGSTDVIREELTEICK